jgi:hypothetical protein
MEENLLQITIGRKIITMTIADIVQQAKSLSHDERKILVKQLMDLFADETPPKEKRHLREFRGIGAHLYDGTDAQEYVNQLRSDWDDRS